MANASVTLTVLEAVQTAIVASIGTASGATHTIADANIVDKKVPWSEDDTKLPGVLLTPVPEVEQNATNASDDIAYGVQVTIAQISNRDTEANADRIYYWRERLMGLFRNKRVTGVTGSWKCTIEPKPVIDLPSFANLYDATAFVVRVWVRTQRPA